MVGGDCSSVRLEIMLSGQWPTGGRGVSCKRHLAQCLAGGLPVAKAHRGTAPLPVNEEVRRHSAKAPGAAVQGHVVGVVPPKTGDFNGQTGNVLFVRGEQDTPLATAGCPAEEHRVEELVVDRWGITPTSGQ